MSWANISYAIQKGADFISGSASRSEAAIADGADEQVSVTVAGASLGDYVIAWSYSVDLELIELNCYVSAANTVVANFTNNTGGSITLDAGTVRVVVMKRCDI